MLSEAGEKNISMSKIEAAKCRAWEIFTDMEGEWDVKDELVKQVKQQQEPIENQLHEKYSINTS